MAEKKSWVAYVTACKGSVLLGGVKHHQSCRLASEGMASRWTRTVLQENCKAGRHISAWGRYVVDLPPEVEE